MSVLKRITVLCIAIAALFVPVIPTAAQQSVEENTPLSIEELQTIVTQLQQQIEDISQSQAANFPMISQTLAFGDQGPEVVVLQQRLNAEPGVQVAVSGAGSPGNETNYFGPKTLQAVKAFQQKYSSKILDPLGLTTPTGVVGASTRSVLNQQNIQSAQSGNTVSSSNAFKPDVVQLDAITEADGLYIREPEKYTVSKGETVSVSGGGFTDQSGVVIGDTLLPFIMVNVQSNNLLEVTIPESFETGLHDLRVVNGSVYSKPSSKIIITESGTEKPAVTSVTQNGKDVFISGEGFTDSNIVHTNYKRFYDVPEEEGVLKIPKEQIAGPLAGSDFDGKRQVIFYVINENGVSNSFKETIMFTGN